MPIPKKIAYSIPTVTVGVTAIGATSMGISDETVVPHVSEDKYAYAVLCSDSNHSDVNADFETVKVTAHTTGTLTIERAIEGAAKEWPDGSAIRFSGTYSGYQDLVSDIDGLDTDLTTHVDATSVHGAVSAATADRIIMRDANGRARVGAPDDDADIARKQDVDAKVAKAGDTMTGNLDFDFNLGEKLALKLFRETAASTSGSGTRTFDIANGTVFKHSMTGAITVALTAPGTSGPCYSLTLIIKMHSSTASITWPASVKWPDNEIPDAPPVNKVAIYTFFTINNGTRWHGFQAGNNMDE